MAMLNNQRLLFDRSDDKIYDIYDLFLPQNLQVNIHISVLPGVTLPSLSSGRIRALGTRGST